MKNLLIGLSFVIFSIVVGLASFYLYKKNEVDSAITKLDGQILNALALENDIFINCMDGKEKSEQNTLVCEKNTERQLKALTQEALSKKQQLEKLSLSEIMQY